MKNLSKSTSHSLLLILCLLMMGALLTSSALAQDLETTDPAVESPIVLTLIPDEVTGDTSTIVINQLPESTASPASATDPIVYLIVVVLAVLLVAALVFGSQIMKLLATLVPPETAASIYQAGVRLGLEMALNKAAETPTEADDDFFKKLAGDRGLIVNRLPTGQYEVRYTNPPEFPQSLAQPAGG